MSLSGKLNKSAGDVSERLVNIPVDLWQTKNKGANVNDMCDMSIGHCKRCHQSDRRLDRGKPQGRDQSAGYDVQPAFPKRSLEASDFKTFLAD